MKISKKVQIIILATVAVLFLSSCRNEWDHMARKGNTWEYELTTGGNTVIITAEVKDTYKIGKRKFAELNPNRDNQTDTLIYGWDNDAKAITFAGRSSYVANETSLRFFVAERPVGHLKSEDDQTIEHYDGTEVVYLGEEEVTVPAGDFKALKFVHRGDNNTTYWYATKTGPVQIQRDDGILKLREFTKGDDDPIDLGGRSAARAFELVQKLYLEAAQGNSVDELFTAGGRQSISAQNLRRFLDKIKEHNKPEIASIAFTGENELSLRFLLYTEAGGTPNVERTDATITVADGKIDRLAVNYSKIMQ